MAKKLTVNQQRQANYTRLRNLGFTKNEATELVSTKRVLPSGRVITVPLLDLSVPFVKTMMKSRARSWERARKKGTSRVQFEKNIKKRLEKKGVRTVWDLVRIYEKRYTDKHPEYFHDKKVKREVTKGDVKAQKERARARERSYVQFTDADGNIELRDQRGIFVKYLKWTPPKKG